MYKINPITDIKEEITVLPDKSISHRALIFSSLCREEIRIHPFLKSNDTLATLDCIKNLGVNHYKDKSLPNAICIKGNGLYFTKKENVKLFAAESGTTIRILSGLLVGQKFASFFSAGGYLKKRPMGRIIYPLREMGAKINGSRRKGKKEKEEFYPPLVIEPVSRLFGRSHKLKIASAQVKSALLLAGLYAKGQTGVEEPYKSRDHSERMLKSFGADIEVAGNKVILTPGKGLCPPKEIFIPADFSSAAFFIVLGLILKNSRITIKGVNLNPTRCGLLKVLKRMNADISIDNHKNQIEPYGDITIKSSRLVSAVVEPDEIPILIDEIPILCVAAAFAKGQTQIKGVGELKVKETDRVNSMVSNLSKAGVDIVSKLYRQDNWQIIINGSKKYQGAEFISYGDHRTAMSLVIFALAVQAKSKIDATECIDKSFPGFIKKIESL